MLFRCCGGAFLKYFIKILEGTLKKKIATMIVGSYEPHCSKKTSNYTKKN
jgi:hypothetical protein